MWPVQLFKLIWKNYTFLWMIHKVRSNFTDQYIRQKSQWPTNWIERISHEWQISAKSKIQVFSTFALNAPQPSFFLDLSTTTWNISSIFLLVSFILTSVCCSSFNLSWNHCNRPLFQVCSLSPHFQSCYFLFSKTAIFHSCLHCDMVKHFTFYPLLSHSGTVPLYSCKLTYSPLTLSDF